VPDPRRELATTRLALLELRDEQRLVQEGYQLLDEKRILLAGQIRRELARLRGLHSVLRAAEAAARTALVAALGRHGLDALSVHRPDSLADFDLVVARSRFLGLQLPDARLVRAHGAEAVGSTGRSVGSAEIAECIRAHRALLESVFALAVSSLRVRRLIREFVRTERRTRAIENILVPELRGAVQFVEEQLDAMDQEELARLRRSRAATSALVRAATAVDAP